MRHLLRATALIAIAFPLVAHGQQQVNVVLGSTVAVVTNPTDEVVHLYQIYGVSKTSSGGATGKCVNLGDIQAKDSVRVGIVAGTTEGLVFYFQADSSNAGPLGLSLSMRAQAQDTVRWIVAPRLNSQSRSQQMASRGVFSNARDQQNQLAARNPSRC